MKIKIRGVVDFKKQPSEKIVLDVLENCDIGEYLIFDTTYTKDGKISNKLRHSYWFPDQIVKKGDIIVLYTKEGSNTSTINANGTRNYFYYWNLKNSVWNDEGDCALLMHIDKWTHKKANQ